MVRDPHVAGLGATGLLDRDDELERIDTLLSGAARSGVGGALVLEGPAGIGKTALLEAAREHAAANSLQSISAVGNRLERDFAGGAVRGLLDPAVAHLPPASRKKLARGPAAATAGLLSALGDESVAPPEGGALFHGLFWVCAALAGRGPMLAVVDDLQWIDALSLRFLAYLARRMDELPLALVASVRTGEDAADREALEDLIAGADLVIPRPLGPEAVFALLARRLSSEPDPGFAVVCREVTAGNPFYLSELATALQDQSIAPVGEHIDHIRSLTPASIGRAVLLRLTRLSPGADALARAVTILGSSAPLRLAAALAGLDMDEAALAAQALSQAEILRPESPLQFVHPIVEAAIHGEVGTVEQSRAHAAAARLLAAEAAPRGEIATHLLRAEPVGDPATAQLLVAAADDATRRGSPEAAAELLRRALEEPPPEVQRPELLFRLGVAEARGGQPAATDRLLEAFEKARDDGRLRAEIARELTRAARFYRVDRPAFDAIEQWLAAEDTGIGAAEQLDLRVDLLYIAPDRATYLERLDALASHAPGDSAPGRRVLAHVASEAFWGRMRTAEEAATLAERALGEGRLLDEQSSESWEWSMVVHNLTFCDRFEAALHALDLAEQQVRTSGAELTFAVVHAARAEVRYWQGELDACEADALIALDVSSRHGRHSWPWHWSISFLARVCKERGEFEQAHALLDRVAAEGNPEFWWIIPYRRGEVRVAEGDLEPGVADLLRVGEGCEAAGGRNPADTCWRTYAAPALAALGRRNEARELIGVEVALARSFGAPRALGMALHAAGLVEERLGVEHLEEAVAVLAPSGAALEHARALADLGAALRRRGSASDAREPLRVALALAQRLGAARIERFAVDELAASGVRRISRAALSGVEALTPNESRIAGLARDGRSNTEIAQELFLSVKTVEMHLSRAYRKLDIRSRKELRAALG